MVWREAKNVEVTRVFKVNITIISDEEYSASKAEQLKETLKNSLSQFDKVDVVSVKEFILEK